MSSYNVTVSEFPAKKLVGMKTSTTMEKAKTDCPAIWHAFGPRICEIFGESCSCQCSGGKTSFGVSIMHNETEFDYFAAVESSGGSVPSGMQTVEIPAGKYAHCSVPNIENLCEAYTFLYDGWTKSQNEYMPKYADPCFEIYPPNWQLVTPFEIYMPVTKKNSSCGCCCS